MLTPFDDYPLHQTGAPIAHPASGDRNHYDRYFFNGYDATGDVFFAAAMGHYPNRHVVDAAFSVVHAGVQRSVFASGRIDLERSTRVGPIAVDVIEPLRTLRLRVDAATSDIAADVTFEARTAVVEEPRLLLVDGTSSLGDWTRLAQWGHWSGSIHAGGADLAIEPSRHLGTRDRSWGVRPVGEPPGGAPRRGGPSLFWLWAPVNFDDCCTHLALFEHGDGRRWYESALRVPVIGPEDPVFGEEASASLQHFHRVDIDLRLRPGTRRSRAFTLDCARRDGSITTLTFEPLVDFQMSGIGYMHPTWAHGTWHGDDVQVAQETFITDEADPVAPSNVHVQQLCRVRMGERVGTGVLEQLIIGPHAPTGLTGLFDGAGA
jgi:hypothetical protein